MPWLIPRARQQLLMVLLVVALLSIALTIATKVPLRPVNSNKPQVSSSAATTATSTTGGARAAIQLQQQYQPDFSPYTSSFPELGDEEWSKLNKLACLMYDWNSKVNLISRQDICNLVPNHIMPCLALLKVRRFANGERIIDVGTGGGLPGLPLACTCPDAQFTLLDSNSKKMMVVQDLVDKLGLKNVVVVKGRAEEHRKVFDFVLGRAVSALPNFLSFSCHFVDGRSSALASPAPLLLRQGGKDDEAEEVAGKMRVVSSGLLYLKGGNFSQEVHDAKIAQPIVFPIAQMLPSLATCEKNVLFVPASEIIAFSNRKAQQEKEEEEEVVVLSAKATKSKRSSATRRK